MINKNSRLIFTVIILVLSLSFISAGFFGDIFDKITGRVIELNYCGESSGESFTIEPTENLCNSKINAYLDENSFSETPNGWKWVCKHPGTNFEDECFAERILGKTTSNYVLEGNVIDEEGYGLAYASIKILGTRIGGITDKEGIFKIVVPENKYYTIEISYVGYKTLQKQVSPTDQEYIYYMEIDPVAMGEIVVVGEDPEEEKQKGKEDSEDIGNSEHAQPVDIPQTSMNSPAYQEFIKGKTYSSYSGFRPWRDNSVFRDDTKLICSSCNAESFCETDNPSENNILHNNPSLQSSCTDSGGVHVDYCINEEYIVEYSCGMSKGATTGSVIKNLFLHPLAFITGKAINENSGVCVKEDPTKCPEGSVCSSEKGKCVEKMYSISLIRYYNTVEEAQKKLQEYKNKFEDSIMILKEGDKYYVSLEQYATSDEARKRMLDDLVWEMKPGDNMDVQFLKGIEKVDINKINSKNLDEKVDEKKIKNKINIRDLSESENHDMITLVERLFKEGDLNKNNEYELNDENIKIRFIDRNNNKKIDSQEEIIFDNKLTYIFNGTFFKLETENINILSPYVIDIFKTKGKMTNEEIELLSTKFLKDADQKIKQMLSRICCVKKDTK